MGPAERAQNATRVRSGMTPDQVRALVGPPRGIARQILYRRYIEQWLYDSPPLLWIEFDCWKGREPQVQKLQLGGEPK